MPARRRVIPEASVARLPLYHRCLLQMQAENRITASSEQLAEMAGVNAAKVRKDLSYLGSYGTRGVGYGVDHLLVEIRRELGLTHDWPCVIVGAGNLGSALAKFAGFSDRGFSVVAVVDIDSSRVGDRVGELTVQHEERLADLVVEHQVVIGIITTPPAAAQDAAETFARAGVRSILNFAPTVLDLPPDVLVRDVDFAVELQILAFHEERRAATEASVKQRASAAAEKLSNATTLRSSSSG
ncbi:MAG: redox-sensing transcriptional repressor Rex [Microthrixaceae bacterium]